MNRLFYILAIALLGGILVHLVAIITMPQILSHKAWLRFDNKRYAYRFNVLPEDDPVKKSFDPFFLLAACSFDLSKGPLKITANDSPNFWSMSIYEKNGNNFYSLNSNSLPHGQLDMILMTMRQAGELYRDMQASTNNILVAPEGFTKGFAIIRSFAENNAERWQSKNFLLKAGCDLISNN